ncbi:MAG: AAA family ATPase [Gammaproteobacteria bacterium]|nr:AAA family ATPase [Gammaproteobacteria bacterium]
MNKLRLPIGNQSFQIIREKNCYYVDKTRQIRHLIDSGDYYFLSRPRRFGKSLLLSTLKELFESNEPLFRGLHIHKHWDWSVRHPVLRLSFDGRYECPEDVERSVIKQLGIIERNAGLAEAPGNTAQDYLLDLLDRLHHATGQQIVVLVDEYDKPILDVIDNKEMAIANRDKLRGIYGIIKGAAEHVRFVLVTGVSMFSKVSLFSDLNNLNNISLDPNYATICGFTDKELNSVFAPELAGLDRDEIRRWYNGYNWLGDEKVYNPFDILLLFQKRKFKSYWFETGTPTFLLTLMMDSNISLLDLEKPRVSESELSKFDVNNIGSMALFFQTGYLTIAEEQHKEMDSIYTLDYPNFEVRQSLTRWLFEFLEQPAPEVSDQGMAFAALLASNDFQAFAGQLDSFLAGIPYQWLGENARKESWYVANLFGCLRVAGLDVRAEESSRWGRADMVVLYQNQVFVFELKIADSHRLEETAEAAIEQIRDRGYVDKYRHLDVPIHLIGIAFNREGTPGKSLILEAMSA